MRLSSLALVALMSVSSPLWGVHRGEDGQLYESPTLQKIHPDPLQTSAETLDVILFLKHQPQLRIAAAIKAVYRPQREALWEESQEILRRYTKEAPGLSALPPEARSRLQELSLQRERLIHQMRQEIAAAIRAEVEPLENEVAQEVAALGGRVKYRYLTMTAVAARIPASALQEIADHPLIAHVSPDRLMKAHLAISTHAMVVDSFWNNGETGDVWDGAVLDTGIDVDHPALTAHHWLQGVFHATAQTNPNYADNPSSTDDLQGHGTHVGGIVWSRGSSGWTSYKGVAYGVADYAAGYALNGKAGWLATNGYGYMYWSDGMAAADWAATNNTDDADALNLSFGGCTSDDETGMSRFFDAFVETWDVFVTISAGNYDPDEPCTRYIGDPAVSYNAMAVAIMNDNNTTGRSDDQVVWWTALGPTNGGRKKPDIGAPGYGIYSANNNWESGSDFVSMSGTSMAAPHVMGTALLLLDAGVPDDPKVLKALLINNSDPWNSPHYSGSLWSDSSGWGYINLGNTWAHLDDYFVFSLSPRGQTGSVRYFRGPMNAGDRATLVWNRHAVYNGSNYPGTYYDLNDINMRLYTWTGTLVDYDLDINDNVHQVEAPSPGPQSGVYVIKVYAWDSSFEGVNQEEVALATPDGFQAVTVPFLPVFFRLFPETLILSTQYPFVIQISNNGELPIVPARVTLSFPQGGGFQVIGPDSVDLGSIEPGDSSQATFQVLTPPNTGTYPVSFRLFATPFGDTLDTTFTTYVTITQPPPTSCDTLKVARAVGTPGSSVFQDLVMINFDPVGGYQGTVHFDSSLVSVDSLTLLPRGSGYNGHMTLATSIQPMQASFLVYGFPPDSILPGTGPVVRVWYTVRPTAPLNDSMWVNLDNVVFSSPQATTLCVEAVPGWLVFGCLLGDVNTDGVINVADVIALVNIILGLNPSPTPEELCASDVNQDGAINIADVVGLINLILGPGPTSYPASGKQTLGATPLLRIETGRAGYRLSLETGTPIAGLQFSFELPEGAQLPRIQRSAALDGFEIQSGIADGELRILIYSLTGAALTPGAHPLFEIQTSEPLVLKDALASDPQANLIGIQAEMGAPRPQSFAFYPPRPNPAVHQVEIAFDLPTDQPVTLRVYDIGGRKVRTLLHRPLNAGQHRLSWDLRNDHGKRVSQGVYFLILETPEWRQVRKVLISR